MGGRRQEIKITRQRRFPKETLGREGNGSGDTREGMKEELGGNGREWERTPSLRPCSRTQKWEETEPLGPRGGTESGGGGPQFGLSDGCPKGRGLRGGGAPGEPQPTADRPGPGSQEAAAARPADPCRSPHPTPRRASRPGPVGRLSPGLPPPSAACLPLPPTRTDLSWPPPAPPLPSRRLRRILRSLPKLFPLIPSSAAAAASHAARAGPAPTILTSPRSSGPPPSLRAPFRPGRGQSPRVLETPLILHSAHRTPPRARLQRPLVRDAGAAAEGGAGRRRMFQGQ